MQSDADKVAEFRAFMRMRRTMPDQFSSYAMRNFTRFLLKARAPRASQRTRSAPLSAVTSMNCPARRKRSPVCMSDSGCPDGRNRRQQL